MIVELVGTAGAICLLLAYFLIATHRVSADRALAHLLNLAGAAMLGVNAVYHGAYPPAALNILWAGIALTALARSHARVRP
jgi:hypothetical protein